MLNKFCVYIHVRNTDGKIFYVGKGSRDRPNSKSNRNKWWSKVVKKHGYHVKVVRTFENECDAFATEVSLISFFKESQPIVNLTNGGEGISGWRHTDECKYRMSLVPKPNPWLKGRNVPEYLKEVFRQAKLGKKQSPEHAQKSRNAKIGKKISDTSKFNLDKRKPVKNSNGEVFESAASAARALSDRLGVKASQGNITMCIHGRRKSAYGLSWSFQ